jgi:endonuclease YncB( thermonuclease family)
VTASLRKFEAPAVVFREDDKHPEESRESTDRQVATPRARRVGALVAALLGAMLCLPATGSAAALVNYANVRADASLLVGSQVVRLFGIHVPDTGRTCRTNIRPVRCGSQAMLALDFKIRGFVHCEPLRRHRDRSVTAWCQNRSTDLAAYLIERGWAVALPSAPYKYRVMEKIARTRRMGVWGYYGVAIPSN